MITALVARGILVTIVHVTQINPETGIVRQRQAFALFNLITADVMGNGDEILVAVVVMELGMHGFRGEFVGRLRAVSDHLGLRCFRLYLAHRARILIGNRQCLQAIFEVHAARGAESLVCRLHGSRPFHGFVLGAFVSRILFIGVGIVLVHIILIVISDFHLGDLVATGGRYGDSATQVLELQRDVDGGTRRRHPVCTAEVGIETVPRIIAETAGEVAQRPGTEAHSLTVVPCQGVGGGLCESRSILLSRLPWGHLPFGIDGDARVSHRLRLVGIDTVALGICVEGLAVVGGILAVDDHEVVLVESSRSIIGGACGEVIRHTGTEVHRPAQQTLLFGRQVGGIVVVARCQSQRHCHEQPHISCYLSSHHSSLLIQLFRSCS